MTAIDEDHIINMNDLLKHFQFRYTIQSTTALQIYPVNGKVGELKNYLEQIRRNSFDVFSSENAFFLEQNRKMRVRARIGPIYLTARYGYGFHALKTIINQIELLDLGYKSEYHLR